MKILHIISSFDPKGGGPMEGGRQIGKKWLSMGYEVDVATLDDPDAPFVSNNDFPVFALGPPLGSYGFAPRMVPWLREHAQKYDFIVVNGLWQFHGIATWWVLRRTKIPYFVFTHGMLDPWFKYTYPLKHLKKWLYWPWAEYRLLRDATAVLFTCEEEKLQASKSFWLYKANEVVVNYGTAMPPSDGKILREHFLAQYPDLSGKKLFLFLSRIHKKKGCDILIEAFAQIAGSDPSLHLIIAGPDQTGWKFKLQAKAKQLGIDGRITWPGMLSGDLKWGAYYASEAFVLPSCLLYTSRCV